MSFRGQVNTVNSTKQWDWLRLLDRNSTILYPIRIALYQFSSHHPNSFGLLFTEAGGYVMKYLQMVNPCKLKFYFSMFAFDFWFYCFYEANIEIEYFHPS